MNRTDLALKYLVVFEKYEKATQETIIRNFERIFGESGILRHNKDSTRSKIIMRCTGCTINTVQAWFNRGRSIKMTLRAVCQVVEFLRLDIDCILMDRGDWWEEDLTSRQINMYETLRYKQYYDGTWWRFAEMAKDMNAIELYPENATKAEKAEQLLADMMDYFVKVIGYDLAEVGEDIRKAVNTVEF